MGHRILLILEAGKIILKDVVDEGFMISLVLLHNFSSTFLERVLNTVLKHSYPMHSCYF